MRNRVWSSSIDFLVLIKVGINDEIIRAVGALVGFYHIPIEDKMDMSQDRDAVQRYMSISLKKHGRKSLFPYRDYFSESWETNMIGECIPSRVLNPSLASF